MIDSKQITVGFKVDALKKKEIEQTARDLEVDVSTYLRDGILGEHEKIKRMAGTPDELIFDSEDWTESVEMIKFLQNKYPTLSPSKILLSALKIARQNEGRFVSNKIENHI